MHRATCAFPDAITAAAMPANPFAVLAQSIESPGSEGGRKKGKKKRKGRQAGTNGAELQALAFGRQPPRGTAGEAGRASITKHQKRKCGADHKKGGEEAARPGHAILTPPSGATASSPRSCGVACVSPVVPSCGAPQVRSTTQGAETGNGAPADSREPPHGLDPAALLAWKALELVRQREGQLQELQAIVDQCTVRVAARHVASRRVARDGLMMAGCTQATIQRQQATIATLQQACAAKDAELQALRDSMAASARGVHRR